MSKKRKREDNNDIINQPKKPKKSKDNEDNISIGYFMARNKCTNVTGNNKLSYRDDSAAGINFNVVDEEKLPFSMKSEKKYLLPQRGHQTSTNLDVSVMRHNINQEFVHKTSSDNEKQSHIITIIPHGFQDTLAVKSILDIAMASCKKDADTINNINKKNIVKKQWNNNNVINKIEVVGKENTS